MTAPPDAVLIVDSVFVFRPQYNDLWDYRIWLEIDADLSLARGVARDTPREGVVQATRMHQERYRAAEQLYVAEVDPVNLADLVIDNSDIRSPPRSATVVGLAPSPLSSGVMYELAAIASISREASTAETSAV